MKNPNILKAQPGLLVLLLTTAAASLAAFYVHAFYAQLLALAVAIAALATMGGWLLGAHLERRQHPAPAQEPASTWTITLDNADRRTVSTLWQALWSMRQSQLPLSPQDIAQLDSLMQRLHVPADDWHGVAVLADCTVPEIRRMLLAVYHQDHAHRSLVGDTGRSVEATQRWEQVLQDTLAYVQGTVVNVEDHLHEDERRLLVFTGAIHAHARMLALQSVQRPTLERRVGESQAAYGVRRAMQAQQIRQVGPLLHRSCAEVMVGLYEGAFERKTRLARRQTADV